MVSSNGNSTAQKFGFGGKELSEELGLEWMDFSARNYDASLGRWMNIDPLAEEMRRHSPYNYAFDNPVYFIDPDGMMPQGPGGPGDDIIKKGVRAGKKIINGFLNFLGVMTEAELNTTTTSVEKGNKKTKYGSEKKDAIVGFGETINENAADAVKGLAYAGADIIDKKAEEVSDAANIATLSTGGLSSPVTVPLAKIADATSSMAKVTKGSIHASEGNTDAAIDEFSKAATNAVLGHAGGEVVKSLKKSKAITSKSSETIISTTLDVWSSIITKFIF